MLVLSGGAWGYTFITNNGQPVKWNSGTINFTIIADDSTALYDGYTLAGSIRQAMLLWNSRISAVQFSPTINPGASAGDGNHVNEVTFSADVFGTPFDDPNILAVTTTWVSGPSGTVRSEADIVFNTAWTWDSYGGGLATEIDVQRVALHELGHVLGLDHPDQASPSQSVTAIMNAAVSNIDRLQQDDISGGQALYGGSGGVTAPANDAFANASTITLSGNYAQVSGNNGYATKEAGEPNHAGEVSGTSVWWKWTAPSAGSITVSTAGSNFDTLLGIYTGSAVSALSTVASNDDDPAGGTHTSAVTFSVAGGTTYYIAVDGWDYASGAVTLTLNFTPSIVNTAPSITSQPGNQSVTAGQTAQFSVAASGSPAPSYQWQRLPVGSGTWSNLSDGGSYSGSGTTTLTVGGATLAMSGDQFRCVAMNGVGSATSNAVTLTVAASQPPVIYIQPYAQSLSAGSNVSFSIGASGAAPLTYRWQVLPVGTGIWSDLNNGGGYAGATSAYLSISNISAALNGITFRCVVTNASGSTTSNAAVLTVTTGDAPKITVSTYLDRVGPYGAGGDSYVQLTPTVTGIMPITYQWYKDGVALSGNGADTANYFKNPATQADAGTYTLVASNSAGIAVSAAMQVVWNNAADPQPWLDTFQQGSIVYFLAGSPGRIMRYDLAQESWLPLVILGGSQAVSAFLPTPQGIFVAYGNILARRSLDLQTEVPVGTAPAAISDLFAYGGRIYFQAGSTVYSYDQATLVAGPSFAPPPPWLDSGGLTRKARPAISNAQGFGITTRPQTSPNDIIKFTFATDGSIPVGVDSPYHANFYIGSRQYLTPDESRLIDNSGVVYQTADLTYSGSLGVGFDDLAFQIDGSPVVLRGNILSQFSAVSYTETGRVTLPTRAYSLFANAGSVYAFTPPADSVSNPGVVKVGAAGFVPATSPVPAAPDGIRISVDDVFLDNQVLCILSNSCHGVVRWDAQTQQFLSTLPLRNSPFFSSYAKATNRITFLYGDGVLTELPLAAGGVERQITNFSPYNSPFGFVAMDDLVVLNLRDSGDGGDARLVYGNQGDVKFWSNSGLYAPRAFGWATATRRLYSASDSATYAVYETVPTSGILPNSRIGNNANAIGPFAMNNAGTRLLARNGRIFDGSLADYAQLANPVMDGAWTTNALFTIRAVNGLAQVQKWDGLSFVSSGLRTLVGYPIRIFALSDSQIIALSMVNGYLRFTLLDANLTVISTIDNGPPPTGWPSFTTQPQPTTVAAGSNAVFAVTNSGASPVAYQWQRLPVGGAWADISDGAAYSGTSSANLTITGAALAMNGDQFRCRATNAIGINTSLAATLTVIIPLPVITTQPMSQTLNVGSPANLSVAVSSPVSVTYQWQKDGTDIPGATAVAYNIASFGSGDMGSYDVVVTNSAGSVTSNTATLAIALPPQITTQPAAQTVNIGNPVSFSVGVTSNAPLTYVWQKNGTPIAGAASATYTIAGVQAADAADYTVVVSNMAGSVISNAARLTVTFPPPVITQQPANQTALLGLTIHFTVAATGSPPLAYQWQRLPAGAGTWANLVEGANALVSGVTTASLAIAFGGGLTDQDRFRCVVSNPYGSVTSNAAVLSLPGAGGAVRVAAGYFHSLIIRSDGFLLSQGQNSSGQLGTGTTQNLSTHSVVAGPNLGDPRGHIIDISGGGSHSLYLKSDGTLWAMGSNGSGQLGTGDTTSRLNPVQVASGVSSASAGLVHSLYVRSDGTLWAMGDNTYGQLGDGSTTARSTPVQVATHVIAAAAGYAHCAFLKSDGTLWSMGHNGLGELGDGTPFNRSTPVQTASGVVAIAAKGYHTLFIKSDGTLWAVGYNNAGQLGDGTQTARTTAVQVAGNVVAVAAGEFHSLFLKSDGTLWAMGDNTYGQLGDGTTTARSTPVQVVTGVSTMTAGASHSQYVKSDGTLWAMGDNTYGQLGDGTTTARSTPVMIMSGYVPVPGAPTAVAASDGLYPDRIAISWTGGYSSTSYELWRSTTNDTTTAVRVGTRLLSPYAEDLAVTTNRAYYYWVKAVNSAGTSGFSPADSGLAGTVIPVSITTPPQSQTVNVGTNVTFTVAASGTAPLSYQWRKGGGNLVDGGTVSGATTATLTLTGVQVGDAGSYDVVVTNLAGGVTSSTASLVVVIPPVVTSTPTARQIGIPGQPLTLAVTATSANGPLSYQWKKNNRPIVDAISPTYSLAAFTNADAGAYTLVITDALGGKTYVTSFVMPDYALTQVKYWGGASGLAGFTPSGLNHLVGVASAMYTPILLRADGSVAVWSSGGTGLETVPAAATNVVAVRANGYSVLALRSDGTVVPWGDSSNGLLSPPAGASQAIDASVGGGHMLVLRSDGTVVGWGLNFNGQAAVPPGLSGVVQVAAGGTHSLALKLDGTVVAWGSNASGQTSVPDGLSGVVAIAAGGSTSFALKSDGTIVAWGLADGSNQTMVPASAMPAIAIQAGVNHDVAIKPDRTIASWGANTYGQQSIPADIADVVQVAVASDFTLVLRDASADTAPVITTHPVGGLLAVGQNLTLSVTATGPGPFTYQWRKDGSPLSGMTGQSLLLGDIQLADAGSYDVVVSNLVGSTTSNAAVVSVQVPPAVTSAPAHLLTGTPGQALTLAVTATSSNAPLSYQWYRNNRPIAGATSATYSLPSFANTDAGTYTLEITDSVGLKTWYLCFVRPFYSRTQLLGWGKNFSGQASPPTGYPYVAVAETDDRSFGITRDGAVIAFGAQPTQAPNGLTDVVGVTGGLVLKSDGTIAPWEQNGAGSYFFPLPAGLRDVVDVQTGNSYALALKADGTVVAWGNNDYGQLNVPAGLTGVVQISAGYLHAMAIKLDGSVVLWGTGYMGSAAAPAGDNLAGSIAGAAGTGHSTVLKGDGSVVSWGMIDPGASTSLTGATAVAAGKNHALALSAGGVVAWGDNSYSQSSVPAAAGSGVVAIFAGADQSFALRDASNDTVPVITTQPVDLTRATGQAAAFSVAVSGAGPFSYQWRKGGVNIGNATAAIFTIPAATSDDVGTYDVIITNHVGSVTSAPATLTVQDSVIVTPQGAARRVADPGDNVTLSVGATGLGTLTYQWFHNGLPVAGATGNTLTLTGVDRSANGYYYVDVTGTLNTRRSAAMFVLVAPEVTRVVGFGSSLSGATQAPADLVDAVAIASGDNHAVALRRDGTVRVWGADSPAISTVPAGLTDIVAIAGGASHSLALRSDGTVVGWGINTGGQLDIPAGLANVVAIAARSEWSVALKSDGTVVTWGSSANNNQVRLVPAGLVAVARPAVGYAYAMAVKADGTVVAWGDNTYGQANVPAGLANVMAVTAGSQHSLALKSDGTVVAWGYNLAGQINVPAGLTGVTALAAGGSHSLALKSDGTVVGWGSNTYGETSVPASLGGVQEIAAGSVYSLALCDASSLTLLITGQPAARYVFVPDTANFSVSAVGAGTLSYQWQRRAIGSATWSNLVDGGAYAGVTTATLAVGPTTLAMDGDQFRCVVSDNGGSIASEAATLGAMPSALRAPTVSLSLGSQRRVGQTLGITLAAGDPNGDFSFANLWVRTPAGTVYAIKSDGSTVQTSQFLQANAVTASSGIVTVGFTFRPEDGAGVYTIFAQATDATGLTGTTSTDITVDPNRPPTASFYLSGHRTIGETVVVSLVLDDPDGNYAYSSLRVNTPNRGWLTIRTDNSIVVSSDVTAANTSTPGTGYYTRQFALTVTDGPGDYTFAFSVVDSLGERTDAASQTITVVAPLTVHDAWLAAHFTTAELSDPNISGPNADPDHDGLGNLLEYALSLDPKAADSSSLPAMSVQGSNWTYTYTRPTDRTDLTYEVEYSTDLVNWSTSGVVHTLVSTDGSTDTWRATYPTASAPNCFFRLKVTQM